MSMIGNAAGWAVQMYQNAADNVTRGGAVINQKVDGGIQAAEDAVGHNLATDTVGSIAGTLAHASLGVLPAVIGATAHPEQTLQNIGTRTSSLYHTTSTSLMAAWEHLTQ